MAHADQPPPIRGLADIEAIEAQGLDAALPARSVYGLIERAARLFGQRDAFIYLPDGNPDTAPVRVGYGALLRKVTQAANLFHALGVGPDDCVALLAPNVPETQFALWGAETVARACPINVMLDPGHAAELLRAAGAKVLVTLGPDKDMPIWERAERLRREAGIAHTLVIGENVPAAEGVRGLEDALAEQPGDGLAFERDLDLATPAALFHTGGTTAAPKLARHCHGNQVHTSWAAALYYQLSRDDVVLNGFPLFHVAGAFVYGSACFVTGAAQVLPTRTGMRNAAVVRNLWRLVERHGVTFMACVPTILATLLQVERGDADISRVRVFYTGGSPLPPDLAAAVEKRFDRPVRNIFGMTECAGLVSVEPVAAPRTPGSTGLRLPFGEVRAVAMDAEGRALPDRACAPGQSGVLALRGPNVGPGYTDQARNAGTFEGEWLISGDLGHVDAEGRIFVTGRAKDVIIRGAHNIDPAVIEDAICGHPAVSVCAAVGQPDAYAGELPVAYVVLAEGASATAEDIAAFAAPRIPEPAARPKRIAVVDALPLTPIGKIFKPEIRAWAAETAFCDALAALADNGTLASVSAGLDGGQVRVRVALAAGADPASEAAARAALRDFTIDYDIVKEPAA